MRNPENEPPHGNAGFIRQPRLRMLVLPVEPGVFAQARVPGPRAVETERKQAGNRPGGT
jgi:hypothetical protein